MTICFFGSYNQNYSRNKILIDGLSKNWIKVLHCHSAYNSVIKRYPELIRKFVKLSRKTDVIYVAFMGHLDMPLAWMLGKLFRKKVIFDMFYSMYDTYVFDRKSAKPGSFTAFTYALIDTIAAGLADAIITDTKTHGNYFINLFHLNRRKFHRIFVGGDDTIFCPANQNNIRSKKSKKIIIEFHGMFTRLHGAEFFVKAAKRLENDRTLQFLLIGSSTNYTLPIEQYFKLKPKNMKYIPELPLPKLARMVAQSDISIGHIGMTEKAKSVITNKIFHALASRIAVIAGDCDATRELLEDGKTAIFTRMGDVDDLVNKIKFLSQNKIFREKIASKGYDLSVDKLTNVKLGRELMRIAQKLIHN